MRLGEHFDVVVARPFAGGKLQDVDRVPGTLPILHQCLLLIAQYAGLPRTWITLTGPKAMVPPSVSNLVYSIEHWSFS